MLVLAVVMTVHVVGVALFVQSPPLERLPVPRDRGDGDAELWNPDAFRLRFVVVIRSATAGVGNSSLRHWEICTVRISESAFEVACDKIYTLQAI